jgi:hypothetical protein
MKQLLKVVSSLDEDIHRLTFQAMESYVNDLNTMKSRAGTQVSFITLNFEQIHL